VKILESRIDEIYRRLDILKTIETNPLIPIPVVTQEKLEHLADELEACFRKSLPIGEIPSWADALKNKLIDWHEVVAQEDASVLKSVLNTSDYENLYLIMNKQERSLFAKNLPQNHRFLQHLGLIAQVLTTLSEADRYIIRICPQWFTLYQDRVYCQWKEIEKNSISSEQTMLNAYELGWMHPALRRRDIPDDFELITAVTHTFAYLLLYTLTELPPPHSLGDLQIQIDRFRAYNSSLTPLLRQFFRDWLLSDLSETKSNTPTDCWHNFENRLADINERHQLFWQKGTVECQGDSVRGRNKRNYNNEDNILILEGLPPTHAFAGVADGVSTATIGSGWLASATIKKTFEMCKNQWLQTILALPDPGSEPGNWEKEAAIFFNHVFESVHHAVTEEINRFADIEKSAESRAATTMSSTLIIALIAGNRAVVGHWGDSRAFLVANTGLIRLTEDHNNQLNWLIQSAKSKKPFRDRREKSSQPVFQEPLKMKFVRKLKRLTNIAAPPILRPL